MRLSSFVLGMSILLIAVADAGQGRPLFFGSEVLGHSVASNLVEDGDNSVVLWEGPELALFGQSYQGELTAAIEESLALLYPGFGYRLQNLVRTDSQADHGQRKIAWATSQGRVLVERYVDSPKPGFAKAGEVVSISPDGGLSKSVKSSTVFIFNEMGQAQIELQLSYLASADRSIGQAELITTNHVVTSVPTVAAKFVYAYENERVPLDPPSRLEQRARTIARDRQRRIRQLQNVAAELVYADHTDIEQEFKVYRTPEVFAAGAVYLDAGRASLSKLSHRVEEKVVYRSPSLLSGRHEPLDTRKLKQAFREDSGGNGRAFYYEERDFAGNLSLVVECFGAGYCRETWFENGVVFQTVNGQGGRTIRWEQDKRSFETFPYQVYPFDPNRIPKMRLRSMRGQNRNDGPLRPVVSPDAFIMVGSVITGYSFEWNRK